VPGVVPPQVQDPALAHVLMDIKLFLSFYVRGICYSPLPYNRSMNNSAQAPKLCRTDAGTQAGAQDAPLARLQISSRGKGTASAKRGSATTAPLQGTTPTPETQQFLLFYFRREHRNESNGAAEVPVGPAAGSAQPQRFAWTIKMNETPKCSGTAGDFSGHSCQALPHSVN